MSLVKGTDATRSRASLGMPATRPLTPDSEPSGMSGGKSQVSVGVRGRSVGRMSLAVCSLSITSHPHCHPHCYPHCYPPPHPRPPLTPHTLTLIPTPHLPPRPPSPPAAFPSSPLLSISDPTGQGACSAATSLPVMSSAWGARSKCLRAARRGGGDGGGAGAPQGTEVPGERDGEVIVLLYSYY